MADTVVSLPESLRDELKAPAGPIYTDVMALLAAAGDPLVTVGDVVTHHVLGAGVTPALALVDDRTERTTVDRTISDRIASATFDHETTVENPPATLTAGLLSAIRTALDRPGTTLVEVDGEEDLAAIPAIVAVPSGGSVVYGQPGEGMVLVTVDGPTADGSEPVRARMREFLSRMEGDTERAVSLLEG